MENLTSLYGIKQLISASAHILEHSSSYIDLIFVDQLNLVIDSGIHPSKELINLLDPSLHLNCHHQVIFSKLNLKTQYPPIYAREVWDYGNAQTDLINRAIDQFD